MGHINCLVTHILQNIFFGMYLSYYYMLETDINTLTFYEISMAMDGTIIFKRFCFMFPQASLSHS